jgi:hypothetical protein
MLKSLSAGVWQVKELLGLMGRIDFDILTTARRS